MLPLMLRCDRWGSVELGDIRLRARGRIGMLVWEGRVSRPHRLRVYPRSELLQSLVAPLDTQLATGDLVARLRADGLEFADTRAFVPGDRLRSVNWRASARRGELIVNDRHPDRNADVVLFLDSFAEARRDEGGGDGTLERAVRAAATLAGRYLARRDRVGLVTFGGVLRWLEPGGGLVQRYRLIDALLETGVEFSYAWKDVNVIPARTLPPKALVIAVTPLLDGRSIGALLDLRARGHDLVVVEVSPEDLVRPRPGLDALAYRLWLLQRAALRSQFERSGVAVARWTDEVRTRCGAGGGEGIQASRATLAAVILGAGSVLLAAGIATWLTLSAGPNAVEPVAGLGALAAVGLVVTLAVGRPEGIAAGLLLLGAAYAVILVVDGPRSMPARRSSARECSQRVSSATSASTPARP